MTLYIFSGHEGGFSSLCLAWHTKSTTSTFFILSYGIVPPVNISHISTPVKSMLPIRTCSQYGISQLRSGLHLVTYLDVGNFCDKSTETTLQEICVQVFLRFSDSSKLSQSVSLITELAWLAGIGKSEENLLKLSCKVAPVTKAPHIFWWCHDDQKQSASACECWCEVSCNILYCSSKHQES